MLSKKDYWPSPEAYGHRRQSMATTTSVSSNAECKRDILSRTLKGGRKIMRNESTHEQHVL